MIDGHFHIEAQAFRLVGSDFMYVDIISCARCGSDHPRLDFYKFTRRPHKDDDNSFEWTHWAMCPVLQEPILMRIKDA